MALKKELLKVISEQLNTKEQFQQFQYKKFDENWIVDIASFLPSVDRITRDLRSNLRYEEEVLPVEKTRRVTSESIRHLLRNTRYIREIEDNDGIIPERVLNTLSEIDYGIYENRFIMTLIERLNSYLLNRLDVLKDNLHGYRETFYKFKNEFVFNNTKFGLNINMKAIEDLNLEELDLHNHLIYERTLEVYNIVSRLYNSEFMKIMKRYKRVKPPIMKTQIILKNPDFRNAYLLWLYLDRVHVLDYTLESETKTKVISDEYNNLLNDKVSELLVTIISNTNFGNKKANDEEIDRVSTNPIVIEDEYVGNLNLEDVYVYDLEPKLADQFYLDKAHEQFHENYKRITKRATSREDSLKQVLLDQYSIADQVFEFYFNTNQDDDVFEQLMKHRDPVKRYYEVYEKYKITKVASDVKERIYNHSKELEQKWLDELNKLEIEAKAELRRRKQASDLKFEEIKENLKEDEVDKVKLQRERLLIQDELKLNEITFEQLNELNNDDNFVEENIKTNDKFDKYISSLKTNTSNNSEEELTEVEKMKKHYLNELEKLRISEEKRYEEELEKSRQMKDIEQDNVSLKEMQKSYREAIIKIKTETNAKINETVRKREEGKK